MEVLTATLRVRADFAGLEELCIFILPRRGRRILREGVAGVDGAVAVVSVEGVADAVEET